MTRSHRCLSLLISVLMVFSLFGTVFAGGDGSSREGYHQGYGKSDSYYWVYDVDECVLDIEFRDKPEGIPVQEFASETVVDIQKETLYLNIKANDYGCVFRGPEVFTSLRAVELNGVGSFGSVEFNQFRIDAAVNLNTTVYSLLFNDYKNYSAPIINDHGNYASNCYVYVHNISTMLIEYPSNADSFAGYIWNGDEIGTVRIAGGLEKIPQGAFNSCKNMTTVEYMSPISVTDIEYQAFGNCTCLEQIVIPKTVKTIKPDAFSGDTKLKDIFYDGTEAEWNEIESVFISEKGSFNYSDIQIPCPDASRIFFTRSPKNSPNTVSTASFGMNAAAE